ncbi:hypothetical protein JB92DRAFT_1565803 [Gautieria morchelliformis]|nr:hypothetical protein JB92DRAFT_1565803 [Gautieria morchelliformis]
MNRLKFDLKTRPPIVERPDKQLCGICRRQVSRYTCPTCNLPYCTLTCFRSEAHSDCSETFYRKEIETDIKTAAPKSAEGRNRMLEMLRSFEDENAEESDVLTDDGDDLARKLKDINLDEADPNVILSMLSPPQRESFLKIIRDPSNELAQQLLSSPELQQDRRRPWWESSMLEGDETPVDSDVFGVPPKMMSIPQALTAPKEASESNSHLMYNIVALCLAYAYVTRRLSWSPLSALKTTDSDHTVARDLLSQIAPFLTDRKSTLLFKSVDSVVTYVWSMLEAFSDTPSSESFCVLLSDATTLLRPQPVVVISQDDDADSPVSRWALLAISDIVALFTPGPSKLKHVLLKLNFYAAHLYIQNNNILTIVAEEIRTARLKMQSPPLA